MKKIKIFIKNNKWIIKPFILLLVFVILFLVLYLTNNLDNIYNKAKDEYNKLTVFSIFIYVIFFVYEIFKSRLSNIISDFLFLGETKKTLKNTETIIKQNIESDKKLERLLLENIEPRKIGKLLKRLGALNLIEIKLTQVQKMYDDE